jgi:hypothetical protein
MIQASQLRVKQFPWKICLPETEMLALTAQARKCAVEHRLGLVGCHAVLAGPDGGSRFFV